MRKYADTYTNEENVWIVDVMNAKLRANKLMVIEIINIYDPKLTKHSIVNLFCMHETKYTVNCIVHTDDFFISNKYDQDIECMNYCRGIHYFKTIERAWNNNTPPKNYTGKWTFWHDNGVVAATGSYINGKESGIWVEWFNDGERVRKYEFNEDRKVKYSGEYQYDFVQRYWSGNRDEYVYKWRNMDKPDHYIDLCKLELMMIVK